MSSSAATLSNPTYLYSYSFTISYMHIFLLLLLSFDELIVGAPMYSNVNATEGLAVELGRVYVYINTGVWCLLYNLAKDLARVKVHILFLSSFAGSYYCYKDKTLSIDV